MDVDYARLANVVPLPEGIKNVPKVAVTANKGIREQAHEAYTSPPPEEVIFFFFLKIRSLLKFLFQIEL